MRPPALLLLLLLLVPVVGAGCGAGEPARETGGTGSPTAEHRSTAGGTAAPPPTAPTTTTATEPAPTRSPRPRRLRGIDVSHHQGVIDWRAVAGDGVRFAYLKATEGTTFTDPRYAANRTGALDAGLLVGGYHYYSLCTPGADQGEHFADVLGDVAGRRHLPPVVDLELAGSCATPPPRAELLAEVRAFIDVVERRTDRRVVVYAFPDFEATYGFSRAIDRRQWVRRLGDRPPAREWWIWQHSQTGTVAGIAGPVDLDVMLAE